MVARNPRPQRQHSIPIDGPSSSQQPSSGYNNSTSGFFNKVREVSDIFILSGVIVGEPQPSPPATTSASSIMLSGSPNSTVRVQVRNNGRPTSNFEYSHPSNGASHKPAAAKPTAQHQNTPQQRPNVQQPRGSLVCTLLPALDKLSRTRHGSADLNGIANALRRAEAASPGFCDHFVTELITIMSYPCATNSEIRAVIDKLTTGHRD